MPPDTLRATATRKSTCGRPSLTSLRPLREMGHEVRPIGVYDDLSPIRETIREWSPQIAFMLLEEFHGVVT